MKKIVLFSALILTILTVAVQAQAGLRLRGVMLDLEANMEAIVRGINTGDFEAIESNAREIAEHERPPIEERKKILSFLKEDANGFKAADDVVHSGAVKLSEAAAKKDYEEVIDIYRDVLVGCVNCHTAYRSRIIKRFYGEKALESKNEAFTREAMEIVREFGGRVKPQMRKAMSSGGPVNAIKVCSVIGPEIAGELSRETGWKIKRVSLKPRNSRTALPDEWETKVLQSFDERQLKGEAPAEMAYGEVVEGRFRFMKAQGVEGLCLKCHGKFLAPEVSKALMESYPEDKATGYSLGEVRGAFSLSRGL